MDPYSFDLPDLPTGEGDSQVSLLPGAPFGPEDVGPEPEVRPALPYTEPASINFATPTPVNSPAFEDSILKSWEAEEQAAKQAAEQAQIQRIQQVNGPIFNQRGYDPRNLIANTVWGELVDTANKERYQQDFGWLGDTEFPKWEDYKAANYAEDWEKMNAEQRQESFNHWSKRAADYWIGYNGVDPNEYRTAFTEASQGHLAGEYKGFTVKQLQEDSEWLGSNVPSTFSLALDEAVLDEDDDRIDPDAQGVVGKSFTAKKANLLADKANAEMRALLEAKNFVAQYGGVGEDGKVTKESLENARRSITQDYQDELGDPDLTDLDRGTIQARMRKELGPIETLLAAENPEAEITKWNEAYHRYRRMGQNLLVLQSPELRNMLSSKTAGEFWDRVWNNKADAMKYFAGEAGAQIAESSPAIAAGVAGAAMTGGAAAPFMIAGATGASGGVQEYRAVIPGLIEEEFEKRGLDSKDSASWAKVMQDDGFYRDVLSQAMRKGAVTAGTEAALNAIFSHALKLVPKSIPIRGSFGRTVGFGTARAGEVVAGVTAAGTGEIAGQSAQRPGQPLNWVDISQEVLAEGPGQMQQTALETAADIYRSRIRKAPTQTPTDAGAAPTTEGAGNLDIDSIEREVGAGSIPKSTQAPQEGGVQNAPADGTVPPPSGQGVAGQAAPAQEPVRSAEESAAFFASLPEPKSAFESAQAIVDSKDASVLSPEEVSQAALLEQLSPAEREMFGKMKLAKLAERQKAQQAIKEDETYRKNIIEATRGIGKETSPVETSKGKGMSVQESNRRNEGGFVDLDAVFSGVHDFAVDAWSKAADFATWTNDMVTKFTSQIVPHLERIWNSIASAVKWSKDFFTYTGNKERGTIDLRQPRTDNRPSAGGPFKYSLSPYDDENKKIGKFPIAKSGVIPESEFISVNRDPVQLKRSEFEFYKTIVPDAFNDGMVDVKKLYEGLRDAGPQVTVTRYGQKPEESESVKENKRNYAILSHNWYEQLSIEERQEYQLATLGIGKTSEDIKNNLKDKGWNDEDVENAISFHFLAKELDKTDFSGLSATSYYDQISPLEVTSHPVIRIDLTIPINNPEKQQKLIDAGKQVPFEFPLWDQDNLHENMPNTFGWAMVQPVINPLDGKPAWLVAELQSRWAQSLKKDKGGMDKYSTSLDHPLLATHQKAVLNAVIDEARKAGIETVIISDAETAMMTEMHDRNTVIPNGTYVLPSGETYIIGDNSTVYYDVGESTEQTAGKLIQPYNREYAKLKEAAQKGDVPSVVKQEKGMRVAYDTTLPSIMKEVTGRVGIPVDLGTHKNNQAVYSFDGDYKGEGSNYFKNPDGTPKSNITGKAYDITAAGPKAAMLFADVFGVKLVADSVRIAFRGAREFSTFASQIARDLGKWIAPYAQRLWDTMQKAPATLERVVTEIAAEAAPRQTGRVLAAAIRKPFASEPKNSPLVKSLNRINFQHLPYTERRDIARLVSDYFSAKKGKGPIVKADLLQMALDNAAKLSYERAFIAAQKNFPLSLKGKKPSDFSSESDINGYVASLDNAESAALKARNEARKAGIQKRKDNRAAQANATFEDAKGQAALVLDSDMVKNLSPRMQDYAKKALEAIMKIDPTNMTPAEKEHVTAAMQNVANGKFIGLGAILARAEAVGAMVEGAALKKKNGSLLGIPLSGKFGRTIDFLSAGALPQSFSRHDTRERVTFMTPDAKDWWGKHISKFGNEGLRIAHELQLENVRTIEGIIKKFGFSEKGLGNIFRKTKINSAKRMGIVALLSQYRDTDNPTADLNMQLNNLIRGIQAMQQDPSSVYKAIGQVEGQLLRDFLVKAVENGLIARDEKDQMEVAVAPEEWTAFLFDQLTPDEQGALQEIWAAAGKYTNDIGFVQEFVYGKEWEPWNNYVMQQAMTLNGQEAVSSEGMALDASTLANSEFNTPVGKTQSILNPRVGLAKGQFYNLDIFHTAISGMNQAAYEVGTAQPRMELKALFEDPLSTSLFDSETGKKNAYNIYKDIHQKSLGIETGTSVQGSPGQQLSAYIFMRPLMAWTGLIMNSIVQPVKQGLAPIVAYAIADGALPHMMEMWSYMGNSEVWTPETRKAWIKQATPALLTRIETYDPAYDDLVGSGVIEEIRRLSKDRSFVPLTAEQKRVKGLGMFLNAFDPVAEIPISLSRKMNVTPDAFAARHIFFSEYTRYLMAKKVISSLDEFTPSLPFDKDAARHADQIVTETLGGAASREKRPNVLSYTKSFGPAGRLPVLALRGALMHLAGIMTQMSSDTFRSVGEAFYTDEKNKEAAAEVRKAAQLRIRRNVIQNATFVAIGYATAQVIQNALIFGVAGFGGAADLEGLDEEEKEVLRRIEQARYDAQNGPIGAMKGIRDIGMLFTGGMSTNGIGDLAFDKGMSMTFGAAFKADYEKKIDELEALIKKTTDKNQKKKIQSELDTAKAVYRNLTYQGTLGIDYGLIDGYQDIAGYVHGKVDNAEADRIAMQYYEATKGKPGAMEKSPQRSGIQVVTRAALDKLLRLGLKDVGTAQDRINKARKIVMEKRKSKLQKEDGTARPNPQPIDVQFGSLQ